MRIFAYNPKLDGIEKTYLSSDTVKTATSFPVKNTNNFVNSRRVLVGEMSRERSELLLTSAITPPDNLTLGAAAFPHDADDPVYAIKYDKVRVYRSTTGLNGSYSLLATIDIDVDNTDGKTWYNDANSLDTYFYKVSYYDSIDNEETDQSAAVQATGYTNDQIGDVISKAAKKVGDPDFLEMDQETWLANADDISVDLQTQAKRPYRFLKRNQALNLGAAASTIPFPADFWSINYIEANESIAGGTRVYRPKKVNATKARADLAHQTLGGNFVTEIAIDDEAIGLIVVPKSLGARTGAFNLHYYKKFDDFVSFSSSIEGPTRLAYKYGLLRDYYLMKADTNNKYFAKATDYDNRYKVEVAKLQRTKNIDAGGPSGMGADRKQYIQFGGPRYRQ